MLKKIIKLWFSIPKIHFRNPVRLSKRDSREYEWFIDRRHVGFDERALWNLDYDLSVKICKYLKKEISEFCQINLSLAEFDIWFNATESTDDLNWLLQRVKAYRDWKCPLFWRDINDDVLSDNKQFEILNCLINIIETKLKNKTTNEDIKYIYEYIFDLGW